METGPVGIRNLVEKDIDKACEDSDNGMCHDVYHLQNVSFL